MADCHGAGWRIVGGVRGMLSFGYQADSRQVLERDLRATHLTADVSVVKDNPWGCRYEMIAPLATPSGRWLVRESVWQMDAGTEAPRFITMYPR